MHVMMESEFAEYYLKSVRGPFEKYKLLGEKTFIQLSEEQLFERVDYKSNSIAILVKHLWGNMRSRWTDYLSTDGEKPWRDRDAEFENDLVSREEVLEKWKQAWEYFYRALDQMQAGDLSVAPFIFDKNPTRLFRPLTYNWHIVHIILDKSFILVNCYPVTIGNPSVSPREIRTNIFQKNLVCFSQIKKN